MVMSVEISLKRSLWSPAGQKQHIERDNAAEAVGNHMDAAVLAFSCNILQQISELALDHFRRSP